MVKRHINSCVRTNLFFVTGGTNNYFTCYQNPNMTKLSWTLCRHPSDNQSKSTANLQSTSNQSINRFQPTRSRPDERWIWKSEEKGTKNKSWRKANGRTKDKNRVWIEEGKKENNKWCWYNTIQYNKEYTPWNKYK